MMRAHSISCPSYFSKQLFSLVTFIAFMYHPWIKKDIYQSDQLRQINSLPVPDPQPQASRLFMHVKHDKIGWKQSTMDWFSWLAKANLEPSLVYAYGMTLADNELGEEDIPYLSHELLQSMGISIAKHRLEIIKVAKEECSSRGGPLALSLVGRLLAELRKTKDRLLKRFREWSTNCSGESSADMVTVPRKEAIMGSCRWRDAMVRTNTRLMMLKQGRLLPIADSSIDDLDHLRAEEGKADSHDQIRRCRYTSKVEVEQIRWASLFQDLRPT